MTEEQILRPLFDWRSAVASELGPESPVTRHVLLTLSLHMSVKGDSCFPSIRLLAEETALSKTSIVTHLDTANRTGWICKRERPERSGQGWRRMEYIASIPGDVEKALKAAINEGVPPPVPPSEGVPRGEQGVPPDREKVDHDVVLSSSVNSSRGLPQKEKGQGQNRPPGPTCAHCHGPMAGGHTSLRIGNVCNPCYQSYLHGDWKIEERAA